MELQTLGDRNLRKLAFSHVVHSIKRMNQKHKNEPKNRALQNIVFSILQVGLHYLSLVYGIIILFELISSFALMFASFYFSLGRG